MCFLFHSLFQDQREIDLKLVDPLQRTTVRQFRQFVQYYLEAGYRFISPTDLLNGVAPDGKYALITFDDGYYNNVLARPVLEEYGVPAVFFVSTEHVRLNKCFWWDVLYRERAARGATERHVYIEGRSLKSLRTETIEELLTTRFGPDAFVPRGDVDRPFAPHELRDFASSRFVHIGSHTANHAILTNYSADAMRWQLNEAQRALVELTGKAPVAIAYPNGAHDDDVVQACRESGLKVGFTVRPQKNILPLGGAESPDLMRLGRFATHGESPIVNQCRTYRSDFQLYGHFRDGYLRLRRGQVAQ
jgi:peptidoglycan/xylan/chitin deacetylase (PgdA/CDA1 family)